MLVVAVAADEVVDEAGVDVGVKLVIVIVVVGAVCGVRVRVDGTLCGLGWVCLCGAVVDGDTFVGVAECDADVVAFGLLVGGFRVTVQIDGFCAGGGEVHIIIFAIVVLVEVE